MFHSKDLEFYYLTEFQDQGGLRFRLSTFHRKKFYICPICIRDREEVGGKNFWWILLLHWLLPHFSIHVEF